MVGFPSTSVVQSSSMLISLAVAANFLARRCLRFGLLLWYFTGLACSLFVINGKHLENLSDQELFKTVERDGLYFKLFESDVNFIQTSLFILYVDGHPQGRTLRVTKG